MDIIVGKTLKHYYFKTTSGSDYHTRYAMDSTYAEVIILGSSRASHHYIPQIIEDSLSMSCYNTGRDGHYLFYSYAVFKSIVERYCPELIILDISTDGLFKSEDGEGLASLLPYSDRLELHNIINHKSKYEQLKLLSKIYPYNSEILSIANGNLGLSVLTNFKGYLPLYGCTINYSKPSLQDEKKKEFDANKLNAIDSMASICRQKHIKFIVVQSPRYIIKDERKVNLELYKVLNKNDGLFWNLVNDTLFMNNKTLFKDEAHLNHDGATVFTNIICSKIRMDLKLNACK